RQAAERYLLDCGDSLEFRELAKKFPVAQPLVRLDVPGQVQTIDANRVDRSPRKDQSHSRQDIHRKWDPSPNIRLIRLYGPVLPRRQLDGFRATSGYAAAESHLDNA